MNSLPEITVAPCNCGNAHSDLKAEIVNYEGIMRVFKITCKCGKKIQRNNIESLCKAWNDNNEKRL